MAGMASSPISVTTAPTMPVAVAKMAQVARVATASAPEQGHHMGCTLDGLDEDGLRALQHFISQAQLRQSGSS